MTGLRSTNSEPATVFPVAVALAATWDRALVSEVAAAIGREAIGHGADVLLAPGVNIQRTPLGGRNFEYYSEDPCLAGEIGVAYVKGRCSYSASGRFISLSPWEVSVLLIPVGRPAACRMGGWPISVGAQEPGLPMFS